jgi:YesN/AraC family two-component response regulator
MIVFTLLTSIVPIIIVGITSYSLTTKAVKDGASQDVLSILDYASETIDKSLERVQNNIIQLQLGSFFSSDIRNLKKQNYSGLFTGIYQNLQAFVNGNPQVRDISFYMLDENYLLSSTAGGRKVESPAELEAYDEIVHSKQNLFWKVGYSFEGKEHETGLTLVSTVPLHTNEPIGFMEVAIDNDMFQGLTSKFIKYDHERIYVLDNVGKVVFYTKDTNAPADLHKLITITNGGGEFLYNWEGREYLVTSKNSPINDLLYVDMIPTNELYESSRRIAVITLGIVLALIVAGTALAMIITKKAYTPIRKLVHYFSDDEEANMGSDEFGYVQQRWKEINSKASQLEGQLNEQLPLIREIFALRLMEGQFSHDRLEYLHELLRRQRIPKEQSAIVFIVAYDLVTEGAKFQETDKDLITFTIKNITAELLEKQELEGLVINALNDQVVVWLWTEEEEKDAWTVCLKPSIERIRQQITHYLRFPVTIGLSRVTSQVEDLPDLYREAQLAIYSRMIDGGNHIIESTGITNSMNYRYPTEIENHLIDSLQVGDLTETKRMLDAFSNKVQSAVHNPELVMMSYEQLLFSTLRTAYVMGIQTEQVLGSTNNELGVSMRNCPTIHEINDWFVVRIVEPIVTQLNSKKNQEYEHFITKVTDYIEAHYHLDISLDQCAQICNLSPQYLSKLFKRTLDISFIEYVTQVRVMKAKELLETTDLMVNEIAERVGYNPKNFIRVFKKQVGLPPGQYREMHKK